MAKLYIGLVCLFLVTCSSKKSGGSDGGSEGEVSVTDSTVVNITSSNVASYTLSGTCNFSGQPVTVKFGNATPSSQPTCTDKKWSATWDLTGYDLGTAVTIVIEHKKADDSSTDQVSKPITNSFTCGTGYIAVPPLEGYTDKAFCVMKYEAKEGTNSVPESVATGTPWVSISYTDANTKCTGLGAAYSLISNDEWQTIARNAELEATNWSGGTVGSSDGMNTGHTDNTPNNTLAASTNDSQACEGTGQTCSDTVWNTQRRTHKLSNGKVIWDLGGNVAEFMKDKYDSAASLGAGANMSQVTDTSHPTSITLVAGSVSRSRKVKAHFGPKGDYTSLSSAPYGGLGEYGAEDFFIFTTSDAADRLVYRASRYDSLGGAGIFTTEGGLALSTDSNRIGFRCVHNPT